MKRAGKRWSRSGPVPESRERAGPVRYRPVDAMRAARFTGIGTFMRLPNVADMKGVDAAFIGIPFDTAVSYRIGGRFGPAAIREASRLLRPYNVEQGIEIFEHVSAVDAGDLSVIPGNVQASYGVMEEGLRSILDAGVVPLAMGGDHSITLGELRAIFKRHGTVGLLDLPMRSGTRGHSWGETGSPGTRGRCAVPARTGRRARAGRTRPAAL